MKPLLCTAVCLLLAAGPARASEKIEGAFGIKLGQVFHPTTPPVKKYDEEEAYAFTPEKGNPMFSDYLVCINPDTHVVYEIIAGGEVPDITAYNQWEKEMKAFLHAKYGTLPSQERVVKQGERVVIISPVVSKGDKVVCKVEYEDSDLMMAASQARWDQQQKQLVEEQKRLLQTVDATGL